MPINNVNFRVIDNLDELRNLWEEISPKETIFHDFDFRVIWWKYHNYPLHTIVGYIDDEPIGILPLQWNTDEERFEHWGGYYMENNHVFLKEGYESNISDFYEQVPSPAKLEGIDSIDSAYNKLILNDHKYVFNLKQYTHIEDFIAADFLQSNLRNNLKRTIKKALALGINVEEGCVHDLPLLFMLNKERFGEDSSFHFPFREQIFVDIAENFGKQVRIFVFKIKNEIQGISFSVNFSNHYVYFNSGSRLTAFPGIGNFIIIKNIEFAITESSSIFDGLIGAYGWKKRWHLQEVPQHSLILEK